MTETYEIVDGGMGIKCLKCGTTSYDLGDICNLWCGKCKKFHEDMMAEDEPKKLEPSKPLRGRGSGRKEGWRAVCVGRGRASSVIRDPKVRR